jgi:hypothetical protein
MRRLEQIRQGNLSLVFLVFSNSNKLLQNRILFFFFHLLISLDNTEKELATAAAAASAASPSTGTGPGTPNTSMIQKSGRSGERGRGGRKKYLSFPFSHISFGTATSF